MSAPACSHASLVEALHDGRLGPAEVASTRRHLPACPACTALLADLERLRASLGKAPTIDPLRHQRARLALLRAATTDTPPPRPRRLALALATLGALTMGSAVWAATAHFSAPRVAVAPHQEPTIRPVSAAVFQRATGPRSDVVTLTSGVLDIEVPPLPAAEPFVVQTQDARIETDGATLRLEAQEGKLTRVVVSLGSARLVRGETSVRLSPGGSWAAEPPPALAPAPRDPAHEPVPAERDAEREPAAREPAVREPAAREPAEFAPPGAVAPSARGGPTRPAPQAPGAPSARSPAVSATASSPPAASATATSSPAISAADLSSREFSEAMEALSRGDAGQAAARFERFGASHPGDARADDAAYLRAIALQRAGRRAEAAAAAQGYLATHPRGAHREQVKKISGNHVDHVELSNHIWMTGHSRHDQILCPLARRVVSACRGRRGPAADRVPRRRKRR